MRAWRLAAFYSSFMRTMHVRLVPQPTGVRTQREFPKEYNTFSSEFTKYFFSFESEATRKKNYVLSRTSGYDMILVGDPIRVKHDPTTFLGPIPIGYGVGFDPPYPSNC